MTAYDEARAAGLAALHADSEWHRSDGTGVWRANYGRAVDLVLAAALPHLTDDGAAVTPPADLAGVGAPSAAESATPAATGAAAPSSPHLTDEARAVRNRAVDVIQDNLDGPAHDGGPSQINVAKVVRALTDAGLLAARRKGATPAIDREALRAAERQQVAQSIRDEAVDEAVNGFVQLTAVIRMCEEAGR
jgi:hypothetical protein